MMEKTFDDMSADERVVYLVDALKRYFWSISLSARRTLRPFGLTPENAKDYELVQLIEGSAFGQNDTSGLWDLIEQLRATLADDLGIEGLYEDESEDEEEDEESESDEPESVEA